MAQLIQDRLPTRRDPWLISLPMEAASQIFAGSMVVVNAAGNAVRGAANQPGLRAVGVAKNPVNNLGGAAGARRVDAMRGCYLFDNGTGPDLIVRADIGNPCFVIDDQTVGKTNSNTTRATAGIVRDVDSAGVWVDF